MSAQKYRLEIWHYGAERPTCAVVARGDLETVLDDVERLIAWCGADRANVLTWRKRKEVASFVRKVRGSIFKGVEAIRAREG